MESQELEQKAIQIYKQYGLFLPKAVKEFLVQLANFLDWQDLLKGIK